MNFDPNPLYYEMVRIYVENYHPEIRLDICNEGSSRSSKTWDAFHFIYTFCDHNRNKWNDIYILRDTLTNCRDYTFKEFKKCMSVIGESLEYISEGQKPYCNLFGNNIYFRGLDDESNTEGYPSDIIFINEALETVKTKVDGLRMRCRKLMIYDWNPKYTHHWVFDLEGRPNTFFTRSTYKDNKHLQKSIISEIESYCPWEFSDLSLPEKDRRPNIENIKNKTADKYRWTVYGEGKRAAREGLIFTNVDYLDKWPENIAKSLCMDFGFTNDPTSLGYYGEDANNIYIELLLYQNTPTSSEIDEFARKVNIDIKLPCTADCADKYSGKDGSVEMIKELRAKGWNIKAVSKTNTKVFWIEKMKSKKTIYFIVNGLVHHARNEAENYTWKTINGIAINQPIDKFDHVWDMARYGYMAFNSKPSLRSMTI